MCRFCCSHQLLNLPPTCNTCTPHHVALFPLRYNGTLFPGSQVILDVYVVNYQRLFAELQLGLEPNFHLNPDSPTKAQVLTNAFGVAPSAESKVGALAIATKYSRGVRSAVCYTRIHALVVGRYRRVGEVEWHAPYPCTTVNLICEKVHARIDENEFFPFASPLKKRSAGMITRRAKAKSARKRQWTFVRYNDWKACTPQVLLKRAKRKAMYARLDMDELTTPPVEGDCVSRWSFWLSSCLPQEVGENILSDLLNEESVVQRLVKLNAALDTVQMGRKRKADEDIYKAHTGRRKRQKVEDKPEDRVKEGIGVLPEWPSVSDGFAKFNPKCPVRGYFRPLPPSRLHLRL